MNIILKDNEVLKDQVYGNCEFDILIDVLGDNVVLDNLLIFSPKKDFHRIIRVKGKNCLIKNCRFQDISVNGPIIVVEHKNKPDLCIIQDCLFFNRRPTKDNNGLEAIRLGESKTSYKGEGNNIIINNRFEDYDGEIEAISVKNNNNIIVNNEMINCASTFTLRHGQNNLVAYNFIDGKMKKDSGGIRVCDSKHIILKNVLQNIKGDGLRSAISLMCGVKNSPLNRYKEIGECMIKGNIFFNCESALALGMRKKEATIKPKGVVVEYSIFDRCKNKYSIHKDNIGEAFKEYLNVEDKEGNKKFKYDTTPHQFSLKVYDELRNDILTYKPPKSEEEEEETNASDFANAKDDDGFTDNKLLNSLVKRLKIVQYENRFREIQKAMMSNLNEFRSLMKELKDIN